MADEKSKAILFIVQRNLYYRHYGPFIKYFLCKSHAVHLLHDYSQPREGTKGGYFPSLSSVPQFNIKISNIIYIVFKVLKKNFQLEIG